MKDSVAQLEMICELLVELAALQHLRSVWLPNSSRDRHEIERFMLLEKLISKKEAERSRTLSRLQGCDPELDPLIEALAQRIDC